MIISPRSLHKEDNVWYNKHHFTVSLKWINYKLCRSVSYQNLNIDYQKAIHWKQTSREPAECPAFWWSSLFQKTLQNIWKKRWITDPPNKQCSFNITSTQKLWNKTNHIPWKRLVYKVIPCCTLKMVHMPQTVTLRRVLASFCEDQEVRRERSSNGREEQSRLCSHRPDGMWWVLRRGAVRKTIPQRRSRFLFLP